MKSSSHPTVKAYNENDNQYKKNETMDPYRVWMTNEKLFVVEAGLGQMGINRLLLHPMPVKLIKGDPDQLQK